MNMLSGAMRRLGITSYLPSRVLPVSDCAALMQAMGWTKTPLVDDIDLDRYEYPADLNFRRRRDAEGIAAACRNVGNGHFLEIGTGDGRTTRLMSLNAPEATITTVNLLPEQASGAGVLVTSLPSREEIGRRWREAGCGNVRQVFANTARWKPDTGPISLAFIDGCHDAAFVVHDTELALATSQPGTIIIWHDFSPPLRQAFPWVNSVCSGIDRLFRRGRLPGVILHLRDSFLGFYRVP
jgi:predicted O-methyltransferase YrrM